MFRRKKSYILSAFIISIAVNSPRVLALDNGSMLARLWKFDVREFLVQFFINLFFCLWVFWYNDRKMPLFFQEHAPRSRWATPLVNFAMLLVAGFVGIHIQKTWFTDGILPGGGYFLRLSISMTLILLLLRLILLAEKARDAELEKERLNGLLLTSQLQLLKSQLNPHFFYNALSTLSGVVTEDPQLARRYIGHLSKVFRYSLSDNDATLVTLQDELTALRSYIELLKIRHEQGLQIDINIPDTVLASRLPHITLQPLIENAIKHNIVAANRPLLITITVENDLLMVANNLQPLHSPEPGTGIGLANLSSRYKLLGHRPVEIEKGNNLFVVKLPLF